ncbi:MAG: hypothetical protein HC902_00705 [Calothrix sp. SM1_5_4]|nr:hypothetical protein [Calothrix sp. SM1_5_4]
MASAKCEAGRDFHSPSGRLGATHSPVSKPFAKGLSLGQNDVLPDDLPARLNELGYTQVPLVEDVGTFAIRGGIVDIHSPAHEEPIRLELFGDIIESLRHFDADNQRSLGAVDALEIIPAHEILFTDENRQKAATRFKASFNGRDIDREERKRSSINSCRRSTSTASNFAELFLRGAGSSGRALQFSTQRVAPRPVRTGEGLRPAGLGVEAGI